MSSSLSPISRQEASKEQIPWAENAPLPLAQRVRDTPEGHLEVPLHPAAEKFWVNAAIYKNAHIGLHRPRPDYS